MIIDTCLFLNENAVFALRYDILHPVVDRFIVIESDTTYQGNYKGYTFAYANLPKVEHVRIQYPIHGTGDHIAMEKEWYTRDILTDYLRADDNDFVMLSDVDEIPSPDAITWYVENWHGISSFAGIGVFEQYLSYYYANLRAKDYWYGTKIARRGDFRSIGDLRRVTKDNCTVIQHGGWHMSYLGNAEQRQYKLESFGHADAVRDAAKTIEDAVKRGVDYLGRADMQFSYIEHDDPTLPPILFEYPEFLT